jgi:tryptophan synthase alpha chain
VLNRIDAQFRKLKEAGKKAFIPYIMAGDPSLEKTGELVLLLEECGADIIELGVPFSDPLADGPTIQRAAERALKAGVTLRKVLGLVKDLRSRTSVPLVLMTYYNPVFVYGEDLFVSDAVAAGVDGLIIPDLPPDEARRLVRLAKPAGLATIFLLAPTSTEERIAKVTRASAGFVYYVSMTGITGSHLSIDESLATSVRHIREAGGKPVAVGFGVSTPEEARAVAAVADGVIVGSAIVRRLHDTPGLFGEFVRGLRRAI